MTRRLSAIGGIHNIFKNPNLSNIDIFGKLK